MRTPFSLTASTAPRIVWRAFVCCMAIVRAPASAKWGRNGGYGCRSYPPLVALCQRRGGALALRRDFPAAEIPPAERRDTGLFQCLLDLLVGAAHRAHQHRPAH